MMAAGVCDAAVVGGVDSLCLTTLYGFQLARADLARAVPALRRWTATASPSAKARDSRCSKNRGATAQSSAILLLGVGESCDAYHMSTPHPEGAGREARDASRRSHAAGLAPADIDYINLHGTATKANDASEDQAVFDLFGGATPASSTKGSTGHLLGAAGITEAIIAMLAIEQGLLPGGMHTQAHRSGAAQQLSDSKTGDARVQRVLTNSFGFGGSNCSLVLGAAALMRVFVEGVGLLGAGPRTVGRRAGALLAGDAAYVPAPTVVAASDLLPAAERRRTGLPVKLALAAGREAFVNAGVTPRPPRPCSRPHPATAKTCTISARRSPPPEREISPTRFHNSVHNAPAGYWSIATRSHAPSTSLCCHDASFAAGLLDAAAQIAWTANRSPLITYDQPYPEPLHAVRPDQRELRHGARADAATYRAGLRRARHKLCARRGNAHTHDR